VEGLPLVAEPDQVVQAGLEAEGEEEGVTILIGLMAAVEVEEVMAPAAVEVEEEGGMYPVVSAFLVAVAPAAQVLEQAPAAVEVGPTIMALVVSVVRVEQLPTPVATPQVEVVIVVVEQPEAEPLLQGARHHVKEEEVVVEEELTVQPVFPPSSWVAVVEPEELLVVVQPAGQVEQVEESL
jgi:hypothetical protein